MPEWQRRSLGDCGRWLSGGTPRTTVDEYWGGDVPWITSGSLTSFLLTDSERRLTELGVNNGSRRVPRNTILFVVRGMSLKSEFRIGIATRPMAFGQDCKAIIPADDVEPLYLANALRAASREVLGMVDYAAHGTGRLNTDRIKALPIPLPPLPTQRKIAAVLAAYDELIENNLRRIQVLEETAQALYREWFVNFRFPGHEDVALVDSPLGPIPEGWEITPFSELAQFINGFAFRSKDHWQATGKPIVKIKELKNGVTDDTPRYHGDDIKDKYHIDDGDLLFSWSADLDAYLWRGGPALLNQHLFRVLPEPGVDRTWLYQVLRTAMPRFRSLSGGTTMKHIKRAALTEVAVARPIEPVQAAYVSLIQPMVDLVTNLAHQNTNLSATRDLLLPKLVSRVLDVSEIEIDTEWLAS